MNDKLKAFIDRFMDWVNGHGAPAAACLLLLVGLQASAAIAPDRLTLKYNALIGGGVAGNSTFKFDIGSGASNPGLSYQHSDTSLVLNKPVLRFGSGASANQILEADIGNGATNPKVRYNVTSLKFEVSNDGTNYYQIGTDGGTATAISALNIDWSLGNVYTKTLAANSTFTFSNLKVGAIVVRLTNTASNYTVTWPVSVLWSGGTPPVQTVGAKSDVYTFVYDGTTVYGSVVQNF